MLKGKSFVRDLFCFALLLFSVEFLVVFKQTQCTRHNQFEHAQIVAQTILIEVVEKASRGFITFNEKLKAAHELTKKKSTPHHNNLTILSEQLDTLQAILMQDADDIDDSYDKLFSEIKSVKSYVSHLQERYQHMVAHNEAPQKSNEPTIKQKDLDRKILIATYKVGSIITDVINEITGQELITERYESASEGIAYNEALLEIVRSED